MNSSTRYKSSTRITALVLVLIVAVSIVSMIAGRIRSHQETAKQMQASTTQVMKTQAAKDSGVPKKQPGLSIPGFSGYAYVTIHKNQPYFMDDLSSIPRKSFQKFSELDKLGRCGTAQAVIGRDIMPTEERGRIGMIKPSGWHTVRYDDLIKDRYLYNRCHLIGYQLTGQNANPKNLITGTRYLNVTGMLPFENEIADYVKGTGNHIYYRVTPIFQGNDLVCRGVLMEASDLERDGHDLHFCIFVYNVQPGIEIDYATGDSKRADKTSPYRVSNFKDKSGVA